MSDKVYNSQGRSMNHAITGTNSSIPNNSCSSSIIFSMDSGCSVEDNNNLQTDPSIIEKHKRRISKLSPMLRLLIAEEYRGE